MAAQSAAADPLKGGSFIQRYSDVLIAVSIVTIVIMMIIPLPTLLLDLLLCLNITIALLVVMSAIYNVEALDLSIFPSLLLITTLFRLALNISSTRLILLDGYAGEVITAFGMIPSPYPCRKHNARNGRGISCCCCYSAAVLQLPQRNWQSASSAG